MKLNTELSHEAEYLGDVQENRVGIDKSNLDFITTLLTSNLYSKPLESFFRETVSNAYDSHVEVGTEEHILLLIEDAKEYNTYRISIRDYGVGLSPERFDKIYKNVGSSTKRESNDYIGMFGIGRFSCLSCADVANITSYYNGVKYSYLMYKNGGGINIDKISETAGDYKNGLEVSIKKYIGNYMDFRTAINSLCLFDKLFITYKGEHHYIKSIVDEFNNRKVVNFNTFSCCNILSSYATYFKVGRVLYTRDTDNDGNSMKTSSGIIIDLPIGSVDITPNREALQYTDYTNKEILLRITKVKEELQELVNNKIHKDITLTELCNNFIYSNYVVAISDSMAIIIHPSDVNLKWDDITIDGEHLPKDYQNFASSIRWFGISKPLIYKTVSPGKGRVYADKEMKNILTGSIKLAVKTDNITKQVTLRHFQENIKGTTVILTYKGLDDLEDDIKKYSIKSLGMSEDDAEECVRFTFSHLPMLYLSNNKVPAEYINSFQEEQKGKRKKIDLTKIPIRRYRGEYGYSMDYLDNLPKGFILYTTHTREDETLKDLAGLLSSYDNFGAVITIKSDHLHLLEHNRRFIKVEDFMFLKNNILSKLITCTIIKESFSEYDSFGFKLPIKQEFYIKYAKQINALRYVYNNSTYKSLIEYYTEKKWLRQADIAYFSLAPKEKEALNYWRLLFENRHSIIKMLVYNKYRNLQKIGLYPVKAPKI